MKDDSGADKFDNIGYGDLAALFKYFHEKDFSCEAYPTKQKIKDLESGDLVNQNCNFSIIFDVAHTGVGQGHYNALFSSSEYEKRVQEVDSLKTNQADQENNNFCHIFKNLSLSIVDLVLNSCTDRQNRGEKLEKVEENFKKLSELIQNAIPSFSPRSGSVSRGNESGLDR